MRRVTIFCLYDIHGFAGADTLKQLMDLREISDYLTVVINGQLYNYEAVEIYADKLITRQNRGYDAGAYKAALKDEEVQANILQSDELVFCNNTFFGPIFDSYTAIIGKMKKSNADFWGLVYMESPLNKHIQSYFMVFRKKIIESGDLYEYMSDFIDENTTDYYEVCWMFEVCLFEYLTGKGYQYDALIKQCSCNIFVNPYQLMVRDHLPIIKKKCFAPQYYNEEKSLMALAYVYQFTNYDVRLMLEYIERVYDIYISFDILKRFQIPKNYPGDQLPQANLAAKEDIVRFAANREDIYIYGAGAIGKSVFYMLWKIKQIKGFIVSDDQIMEQRNYRGVFVYRLSEINVNEEHIGIIVAMAKNNASKVRKLLGCRSNVLYVSQ